MRYYQQVEGDLALRGAITGKGELYAGNGVYGAGSYRKESGAVAFDFDSLFGGLSASVNAATAPGEYTLNRLGVSLVMSDESVAPYTCGMTCNPCIVKFNELNEDLITGSLSCGPLHSCLADSVVRLGDEVAVPDCEGMLASIVTLDVSFRLSGSTKKPLDY